MIETVLLAAVLYTKCDLLVQDYPFGIAKDVASANAVVAEGYGMPEINKKIYDKNRKRLDRNKDGVACERK